MFYLSVTYLQCRFKQIEEQLKNDESQSITRIMSALEEHDQVCRMNAKNNRLTNFILFVIYFFAISAIDVVIYLAIYMNTIPLMRGLFMFLSTLSASPRQLVCFDPNPAVRALKSILNIVVYPDGF